MDKQIIEIVKDLRWYGRCIAGAGPITGYNKAAKEAEQHWYAVTLPMLENLKRGEAVRQDESGKAQKLTGTILSN